MKKIIFFLFISVWSFAQNSISNGEKDALINIYNTTNGNNWSQGWTLTDDPLTWYGVTITNGYVTEINLAGNLLKGNFPQNLSAFSRLTKIDFSANQLTGTIPDLTSMKSLVSFNISENDITGDVSQLKVGNGTLKFLGIGNTKLTFSTDGFLTNYPSLEGLNISGFGLSQFPKNVSALSSLKELNISNNQIQDFSGLEKLTNITSLYLKKNGLQKLPNQILSLSTLSSLDLAGNAFTDFTSLDKLTNLQWLSLENNQLQQIPIQIGSLQNLVHLNLGWNLIQGNFSTIVQLKNLQQLWLNSNLIAGNFPTELLQSKLLMLNVANNQLNGALPNVLPQICNIQNNKYTLTDIANYTSKKNYHAELLYSPQRYDELKTVYASLGSSASLPQLLSSNPDYSFVWYKKLDNNTGITNGTYSINNVTSDDMVEYTCEATPNVTDLDISFFREPVTLTSTLSSKDENLKSLNIFPNPTKDYVNILGKNHNIKKIYMYDESGKKILQTTELKINIKNLPSSIYYLIIETESGNKTFKVIKL